MVRLLPPCIARVCARGPVVPVMCARGGLCTIGSPLCTAVPDDVARLTSGDPPGRGTRAPRSVLNGWGVPEIPRSAEVVRREETGAFHEVTELLEAVRRC